MRDGLLTRFKNMNALRHEQVRMMTMQKEVLQMECLLLHAYESLGLIKKVS